MNWQEFVSFFQNITPETVFILVLAGFVAGFVNTLAGNGSAITMLVMSALDLPIAIANATNRMGVLAQSGVGALTFKHHQQEQKKELKLPQKALYACWGAVLGAQTASVIPRTWLEYSVAALMLFLLWLVLKEPQKWLVEQDKAKSLSWYNELFLFLGIGFYGGYIQIGVGALLLVGLVRGCGFAVQTANLLKNSLVFFFTIPAFCVFWWHGQIHWAVGLVLVLGQVLGAWLAATLGSKHPKASIGIRCLLIASIIAGFLLYSGLFSGLRKVS